jgi:hypothetical protein
MAAARLMRADLKNVEEEQLLGDAALCVGWGSLLRRSIHLRATTNAVPCFLREQLGFSVNLSHRAVPRSRAPAKILEAATPPKVRASRTLLQVSLPLESATFGRPEVAPAGAPQRSCQRLRDWVPEGLILAGARLRGTARCERFTENA